MRWERKHRPAYQIRFPNPTLSIEENQILSPILINFFFYIKFVGMWLLSFRGWWLKMNEIGYVWCVCLLVVKLEQEKACREIEALKTESGSSLPTSWVGHTSHYMIFSHQLIIVDTFKSPDNDKLFTSMWKQPFSKKNKNSGDVSKVKHLHPFLKSGYNLD